MKNGEMTMIKRVLSEIEMAEFIDVSPRQLRSLAERRIAIRANRGEYDVIRTTSNYIDHLRRVAAAREDGLPGGAYLDPPAAE
jgi:phage terminase Nu1 subunit (DNA packaging protein)